MLIEDFNRAMDTWITELGQYNSIRLCTKPSAGSWSLGQVYMHLIQNTQYYVGQIKICLTSNENWNEEASAAAKSMFLNNSFPDEIIEGPLENRYTPQPVSKEQLMHSMMNLKAEMNNLDMLIQKCSCKGKTKHPGLNYFSANEWIQFAEMHLRHHLRQKKRIDDFLTMKGIRL